VGVAGMAAVAGMAGVAGMADMAGIVVVRVWALVFSSAHRSSRITGLPTTIRLIIIRRLLRVPPTLPGTSNRARCRQPHRSLRRIGGTTARTRRAIIPMSGNAPGVGSECRRSRRPADLLVARRRRARCCYCRKRSICPPLSLTRSPSRRSEVPSFCTKRKSPSSMRTVIS